jgi:hypothetical protein
MSQTPLRDNRHAAIGHIKTAFLQLVGEKGVTKDEAVSRLELAVQELEEATKSAKAALALAVERQEWYNREGSDHLDDGQDPNLVDIEVPDDLSELDATVYPFPGGQELSPVEPVGLDSDTPEGVDKAQDATDAVDDGDEGPSA